MAFYFALFSRIFFPISRFDHPPPPRRAHSRPLYEVMFVITIGSGNCNLSPSQSTTASVTEVWVAGQPSSAEVRTTRKEGSSETKDRLPKLLIVQSLQERTADALAASANPQRSTPQPGALAWGDEALEGDCFVVIRSHQRIWVLLSA